MIKSTEKSKIREQAKFARSSIVGDERLGAEQAIYKHILNWDIFKSLKSIALYLADDAEVSLSTLPDKLKKDWFLPAIHPMHKRQLLFLSWDNKTHLIKNKFGILEPEFNPLGAHPILDIDLIFVPTLAFDMKGWRLGRGGGFYDNTLAAIQHANLTKKPLLAGVAFKAQQAENIPHDVWDVKMDYIITEEGCFESK